MTVFGFIKGLIGTAWAVIVGDVVVESVLDDARSITLFGRVLATPSIDVAIATIVGLAFSLGIVIALIATFRARIAHEKNLRTEVDERWEEMSIRSAGVQARHELLEARIPHLQQQLDELVVRRDELLAEMAKLQAKALEIQEMAFQSQGSVDRFADALVSIPDADAEEPVVEIPDEAGSEAERTALGESWSG